MQKMSKKDMMILAGASIVSMAAGIVIGCLKEKLMKDSSIKVMESQMGDVDLWAEEPVH